MPIRNKSRILLAIGFVIMFLGLFLIARYQYLLFHGLVEVFSVIIAFSFFIIMWNARKYIEHEYLLFIGISYLFIALLDLMHTFSYTGMPGIEPGFYPANQLWVAARFMESTSFLLAFTVFRKTGRLPVGGIFSVYSFLTLAAIFTIFFFRIFPVCFISGVGQTPFKIGSEAVICVLLAAGIYCLIRVKDDFSHYIFKLLLWSIITTILQELSFTLYTDNYGYLNILGHSFKIISFYLLYRATIRTAVAEPYELIFKELHDRELQLKAARNAADEANRMKSQFLANMSHEIRTPLNGIIGYTQLMQLESGLSPESREYLDIIDSSGQHLLTLISNILDLSKIEAGSMPLYPEAFNVESMLKEIEGMFALRMAGKGLTFIVECAGDIPAEVYSDAGKVKQILINLVGNALKFTDKGFIKIRVRTDQNKEDSVKLIFSVEDSGVGISESKLASIFEPFVQAGEGTKNDQGTGLGLTISRSYAELMGGCLYASSTAGEGSTFSLEIPVSTLPKSLEPVSSEIETWTAADLTGQAWRLLIADDDKRNRDILVRMLGSMGLTTAQAVNGREALDMCQSWSPDMVLMDFRMPVMDGIEATRRIREKGIKIPIVIVSAYSMKESEQKVLEAGANEFILKPFRKEEIIKVISKLLRTD